MPETPAATAALDWLRRHSPTPPADAHEALALTVHAILLHHDFRPSRPGSDGLPDGWGGAGYGGQYRHERSAMLFDIRGVRMGGRLLVNAVGDADDTRLHTIDLRVGTMYSPGDAGGAWSERLTDLDGLSTIVTVQLVHTLVPDTSKQGYEHGQQQQQQSSASSSSSSRQPPPPTHDHDPLRVHDPPRLIRPAVPLGRDDLLPPGMPAPSLNDPLAVHPLRGRAPPAGNLMGPGHFARPGTLPHRMPPGVPPGARFDPYGVAPDPDMEGLPGFDDDHGLRQGFRPPPRGPGGGGLGDDGPPAGMFF